MGIGINDAMPDEAPTGDRAMENMTNLIDRAREHEHDYSEENLSVMSLYLAMRHCDEEKRESEILAFEPFDNHHHPLGLYDAHDDIGLLLEELGADSILVNVAKLRQATENFFTMTFGQFLDTHGLASLRTVFTYSYELQGFVGIYYIQCRVHDSIL